MDKKIKINFSSDKFDAIICLNGDMPELGVFDFLVGIPLIAADGAANSLFKSNISPNFVVGDIDSIEPDILKDNFNKFELFHLTDQDKNDFEKCLIFAKIKGWKNVIIFGFSGGLLEHTLNNWSVFIRYSGALNLCIFDQQRYGLALSNSFILETKLNELISIIPQPKAKLKTRYLNWNLNNEILGLGFREGIRNISLGDSIEINIISGQILLFCDARLPLVPKYTLI